jgi:hypothetical protein
MSISYAPFGDEEVPVEKPPIKVQPVPKKKRSQQSLLGKDDTECNYLVMFFVLGVCLLAITDSR